eukprot:TRINITY_DN7666_c0_g1_i1.p1 TRINITY_DN7666_c0_g1~~TRINITY_DN7666_c0_g1_i1.p1  ORF type:complete len:203 (+),score=61.33 TRINITY_DN7666_c0_g1_i1:89-697(+)
MKHLCVLFLVAVAYTQGESNVDSYEDAMDQIQQELEEMQKGDPRGTLGGINIGAKGKGQQKGSKKFDYQVGQTVVVTKKLTFKRAKGKKSNVVEAGAICKVTAVPGDSENSVAEVSIQASGTLFDPTEEQIVPMEIWELMEKKRLAAIDAGIDWAGKVKELIDTHAPKKAKKLPAMLKAWKGREKDLFLKLEKDFGAAKEEL